MQRVRGRGADRLSIARPHAARLLGAVLAGGESRRFGSDKASARIGGTTLVERAAETLARVFDDVVIVSSRAPVTDRWAHVSDERSGGGPLAGIEAALREAGRRGFDGAFVLACDMPLVDEHTVRAVVDALGDHRAAAATSNGGPNCEPDVEPLCAAYRITCLPDVARRLDEGRLAVHELLAAVGGSTVELPEGRFVNVNTPADHARASEVLPDDRHETAR